MKKMVTDKDGEKKVDEKAEEGLREKLIQNICSRG